MACCFFFVSGDNIPQILVAVVVALTVAQILIEKLRWQMAPVYVVAGILIVMTCVCPQPSRTWVKLLLFAITVIVVVLCGSLAWIVPVFTLPEPTGEYGVGTATYCWTDPSRDEIFSVDPSEKRQIVAQIWYPSREKIKRGEPYVADSRKFSANLARFLSANGSLKVPSFAFSHFSLVHTHAASCTAAAEGVFPVVVFASGLGGFRQSNMVQVEELVSQGFVVVGLDQPYVSVSVTLVDGTIPGLSKAAVQPVIDQSLVPKSQPPVLNGVPLPEGIIGYLVEDISFVISRLETLNHKDPLLQGHLDMSGVGAFGVSLGAMVVGESCLKDSRLQACLMMDAAMPAPVAADGLSKPALWITRPISDIRLEQERSGGWSEHDIELQVSTMEAACEKSTAFKAITYIPGMFHIDFTDAGYYLRFGPQLGLTGSAGHRGSRQLTTQCVDFFQQHLR